MLIVISYFLFQWQCFQYFPIKHDGGFGWEMYSFHFKEVLIYYYYIVDVIFKMTNGCWILSNASLASMEVITQHFSLKLSPWFILIHLYIPRRNSQGHNSINVLLDFLMSILVWNFASLFMTMFGLFLLLKFLQCWEEFYSFFI